MQSKLPVFHFYLFNRKHHLFGKMGRGVDIGYVLSKRTIFSNLRGNPVRNVAREMFHIYQLYIRGNKALRWRMYYRSLVAHVTMSTKFDISRHVILPV